MSEVPAGWYPDPYGDSELLRWWDGYHWTAQTVPVAPQLGAHPAGGAWEHPGAGGAEPVTTEYPGDRDSDQGDEPDDLWAHPSELGWDERFQHPATTTWQPPDDDTSVGWEPPIEPPQWETTPTPSVNQWPAADQPQAVSGEPGTQGPAWSPPAQEPPWSPTATEPWAERDHDTLTPEEEQAPSTQEPWAAQPGHDTLSPDQDPARGTQHPTGDPTVGPDPTWQAHQANHAYPPAGDPGQPPPPAAPDDPSAGAPATVHLGQDPPPEYRQPTPEPTTTEWDSPHASGLFTGYPVEPPTVHLGDHQEQAQWDHLGDDYAAPPQKKKRGALVGGVAGGLALVLVIGVLAGWFFMRDTGDEPTAKPSQSGSKKPSNEPSETQPTGPRVSAGPVSYTELQGDWDAPAKTPIDELVENRGQSQTTQAKALEPNSDWVAQVAIGTMSDEFDYSGEQDLAKTAAAFADAVEGKYYKPLKPERTGKDAKKDITVSGQKGHQIRFELKFQDRPEGFEATGETVYVAVIHHDPAPVGVFITIPDNKPELESAIDDVVGSLQVGS